MQNGRLPAKITRPPISPIKAWPKGHQIPKAKVRSTAYQSVFNPVSIDSRQQQLYANAMNMSPKTVFTNATI